MKEIQLPNYLEAISQGTKTDLKPPCIHGTESVLKEIDVSLKKFLKNRIIKSIEESLGSSYRAYLYWRKGEKPIPIVKARKIVSLYCNLVHADKSMSDELWDRFYNVCSGFSVDSGKRVSLPKTITPDLAYLIGVLFGDGCLHSHTESQRKTRYGVQITNGSRKYLEQVVLPRLQRIFRIDSKILAKEDENCYNLIIHSKILHIFLDNVVKMPVGRKKGKLVVPPFVKNSSMISGNFLRGLFDTDGWISNKSKAKPSLGLSQSDYRFLEDIKEMLSELRILIRGPYTSGSCKGYELRTFSSKVIKKFARIIGSEHPLKKQMLYQWR